MERASRSSASSTRLPSQFEAAIEMADPSQITESVVCGPEQEGFLEFAGGELLPRLDDVRD